MRPKNKHAVALGKLGGAAGKGSPARRRAALKANRTRWRNHAKRLATFVPYPDNPSKNIYK